MTLKFVCPECSCIEDQQYTCTMCWNAGVIDTSDLRDVSRMYGDSLYLETPDGDSVYIPSNIHEYGDEQMKEFIESNTAKEWWDQDDPSDDSEFSGLDCEH